MTHQVKPDPSKGFEVFGALRASKSQHTETSKVLSHRQAKGDQASVLDRPVIPLQRFDDAMRELEDRKRMAEMGRCPSDVDQAKWQRLQEMKLVAAQLDDLFPFLPFDPLHAWKQPAIEWLVWSDREKGQRLALRFGQPRTFLAHIIATQDTSQAAEVELERQAQLHQNEKGSTFLMISSPEFDGTDRSDTATSALKRMGQAPLAGIEENAQGGRALQSAQGDLRVLISRSPLYYSIVQSLLQTFYGLLLPELNKAAPRVSPYLVPILQGMPIEALPVTFPEDVSGGLFEQIIETAWMLSQVHFSLEENYPLTLEIKVANWLTNQSASDSTKDALSLAKQLQESLDRQWVLCASQHQLESKYGKDNVSKEQKESHRKYLTDSLNILDGNHLSRIRLLSDD